MFKGIAFLGGFGLGLGAMYLLAPDHGAERRRGLMGALSARETDTALPHGIPVDRTLVVEAPAERVFAFWARFSENFPRLMAHVREITDVSPSQTHWRVAGPAGSTVAWDAILTAFDPPRLIAWRSLPGFMIDMVGRVEFQALTPQRTWVHVPMDYHPPMGALGHTVASLLGADPRHELAADLARMKALIETPVTAASR